MDTPGPRWGSCSLRGSAAHAHRDGGHGPGCEVFKAKAAETQLAVLSATRNTAVWFKL